MALALLASMPMRVIDTVRGILGHDRSLLYVLSRHFSPSYPHSERQNFQPVSEEVEGYNLPVRGTIPADLNGEFVRNGPNNKYAFSGVVRPSPRRWLFSHQSSTIGLMAMGCFMEFS
jgi:hypothetical protein